MKKWNHVIESRISLAVLAFGLASSMQAQGLHNPTGSANALNNARPHDDHGDQGDNGNNDNNGNKNQTSPTPPGLYITPKALADAVQHGAARGVHERAPAPVELLERFDGHAECRQDHDIVGAEMARLHDRLDLLAQRAARSNLGIDGRRGGERALGVKFDDGVQRGTDRRDPVQQFPGDLPG